MDNDNKIVPKKQRHDDVLLFLNDELKRLQKDAVQNSYNLEEEYAKTKNHHQKSIIIVLLSSLVAVFLLAFIITSVLNNSTRHLKVSLESFEELNLKELIDSVSMVQSNYENAVRSKTIVEGNMESALKDAENQKENAIFVLNSLKIKSKSDYNNRLRKINNEYTKKVEEVHQKYDSELAIAEKQVEEYKKQMEQFDTAKVAAAQEQQRVLDSERELRQLEQRRISEQYEQKIRELENTINTMRSKNSNDMRSALNEMASQYEMELRLYDPVIQDEKADQIISRTTNVRPKTGVERSINVDKEPAEEEKPPVDFDYQAFLETNQIQDEELNESLENYQSLLSDYSYLEDTIYTLPHKNSLPEYVETSRTLVNKMSKALAQTSAELYEKNKQLEAECAAFQEETENTNKKLKATEEARIQDRKDLKNAYEESFEGVLAAAKASAVILLAKSTDNIIVYVSKNKQDLFEEGEVNAEFKMGRTTIKGTVYKDKTGTYYFKTGLDKNGEPLEFDVSQIKTGTIVKLK